MGTPDVTACAIGASCACTSAITQIPAAHSADADNKMDRTMDQPLKFTEDEAPSCRMDHKNYHATIWNRGFLQVHPVISDLQPPNNGIRQGWKTVSIETDAAPISSDQESAGGAVRWFEVHP
jgi:hypothetical protein